MNWILISIGSNHDAAQNMAAACRKLEQVLPSVRWSAVMRTKPVDCPRPDFFLNRLGSASTSLSVPELHLLFKQIEQQSGRTPEGKNNGIIPLDIDLLQWNDAILKPEDFRRPYVQSGLLSLSTTHK